MHERISVIITKLTELSRHKFVIFVYFSIEFLVDMCHVERINQVLVEMCYVERTTLGNLRRIVVNSNGIRTLIKNEHVCG